MPEFFWQHLFPEFCIGLRLFLTHVALLKDLYLWAYRQSADRYAGLRRGVQPDPVRLRYRSELRAVVGEAVRQGMDRPTACAHIAAWTQAHVAPADMRKRFREAAEDELLSLHEGNFLRYRFTHAEFSAWQEVWEQRDFQHGRDSSAESR